MGEPSMEELEFLVELLQKHPLDSLRRISKEENVDYYRLKRLYDKYYGIGKQVQVNALYNIRRIGLDSVLAFLSIPREKLVEVNSRLAANPFVAYSNPAFGFKNGLSVIISVPVDQLDSVDELLSRYSDDYEYYRVRSYPHSENETFGEWDLSHDYARLMDMLKVDARTPVTEVARRLGKSRPTVKYMMNRLKEEGILKGFDANLDMNIHDRGAVGISRELDNRVLERFKDYEINIGVLLGYGYFIEWYFSSNEDLGTKILEFSNYVEKLLIQYFTPTFNEVNTRKGMRRYTDMVRKDGKGYRSILEF